MKVRPAKIKGMCLLKKIKWFECLLVWINFAAHVTKAIHISQSRIRCGYDNSLVFFNYSQFLGVWFKKGKAHHFFCYPVFRRRTGLSFFCSQPGRRKECQYITEFIGIPARSLCFHCTSCMHQFFWQQAWYYKSSHSSSGIAYTASKTGWLISLLLFLLIRVLRLFISPVSIAVNSFLKGYCVRYTEQVTASSKRYYQYYHFLHTNSTFN